MFMVRRFAAGSGRFGVVLVTVSPVRPVQQVTAVTGWLDDHRGKQVGDLVAGERICPMGWGWRVCSAAAMVRKAQPSMAGATNGCQEVQVQT